MTSDNMLTALCLWEAMLDRNDTGDCATMDRLWDQLGTWEMRQKALTFAPQFDVLWETLNGDNFALDGTAFDWEFIPALLPYVNWFEGGWTVDPDHLAKVVTSAEVQL